MTTPWVLPYFCGLRFQRLPLAADHPWQCRGVAAAPYRVTAIMADHGPEDETALNHVVEQDGRTVLFGNDTGWWPAASWEILRGFQLDVATLECTYRHGQPAARMKHLGAEATVAVKKRLREIGALAPHARIIANHFSHNGRTLHDELCRHFAPHGIEVGYDGMTVAAGSPPPSA